MTQWAEGSDGCWSCRQRLAQACSETPVGSHVTASPPPVPRLKVPMMQSSLFLGPKAGSREFGNSAFSEMTLKGRAGERVSQLRAFVCSPQIF